MNLALIIGNQNYSSWSLRPWLLMKAFDVHFKSISASLGAANLREQLLAHSPSAKVPVLIERDTAIWDSLAICEYINEVHLDGKGWPQRPKERAFARAVTCEMHSGFQHLRSQLPMNIRARRQVVITPEVAQDIARIDAIFAAHHRSGWLFERFGIADCFYAPVVLRFQTYAIELSPKASAYMERLLAHPALVSWIEESTHDHEVLTDGEAGAAV